MRDTWEFSEKRKSPGSQAEINTKFIGGQIRQYSYDREVEEETSKNLIKIKLE